ncbi:hypothetical protein HGP14_30945 [Rhizobium sp. P32RR-XVIII]|uniref:hypothetical protein n=1 Tax=Rhizobium sp. P32RR-XVIII TaxID=2726738 RepID=UPI001456D3AD|nr:hypothetical protein [Rhizobium sp. P32RR-XVIII]NLS07676.1 hypothetical protein [Rhizobium sp. P32RR-XVIII]
MQRRARELLFDVEIVMQQRDRGEGVCRGGLVGERNGFGASGSGDLQEVTAGRRSLRQPM